MHVSHVRAGAPGAAGAGVAEALKGHHHGQALLRGQLQLLAHLPASTGFSTHACSHIILELGFGL